MVMSDDDAHADFIVWRHAADALVAQHKSIVEAVRGANIALEEHRRKREDACREARLQSGTMRIQLLDAPARDDEEDSQAG
jgi:hypothetical protein